MHGREARLPLEIEKANIDDDDITAPVGIEATIGHLQQVKEKIFPKVSENIEKSQKRQKVQYQMRKGDSGLTIQEGHKHEDTWCGPYKVLNISKYGSCRIKSNMSEIKKVNINQLKHYQEPQLTMQPLVASTQSGNLM